MCSLAGDDEAIAQQRFAESPWKSVQIARSVQRPALTVSGSRNVSRNLSNNLRDDSFFRAFVYDKDTLVSEFVFDFLLILTNLVEI